jgi:2-oxoglutarate ferredoxin oxidoreductase subunit delta
MIFIDEMFCKGCGICVRFCPKNVLEISDEVNRRGYYIPRVVNEADCNQCQNCDLYCPDFAIFVEVDEEKKKKRKARKEKAKKEKEAKQAKEAKKEKKPRKARKAK